MSRRARREQESSRGQGAPRDQHALRPASTTPRRRMTRGKNGTCAKQWDRAVKARPIPLDYGHAFKSLAATFFGRLFFVLRSHFGSISRPFFGATLFGRLLLRAGSFGALLSGPFRGPFRAQKPGPFAQKKRSLGRPSLVAFPFRADFGPFFGATFLNESFFGATFFGRLSFSG